MSTTPAFSPMPTSRCSFMASVVLSPNWRRWFLLDLYEQCSDHMTEYMASSAAEDTADIGRRRSGYRRPDAVRSRVRAHEFPGNCGGIPGLGDRCTDLRRQ